MKGEREDWITLNTTRPRRGTLKSGRLLDDLEMDPLRCLEFW